MFTKNIFFVVAKAQRGGLLMDEKNNGLDEKTNEYIRNLNGMGDNDLRMNYLYAVNNGLGVGVGFNTILGVYNDFFYNQRTLHRQEPNRTIHELAGADSVNYLVSLYKDSNGGRNGLE